MPPIRANNWRTQNIANNSVSNFFDVNGEQIVITTKNNNIMAEGSKILISNLKTYFTIIPIITNGRAK